MYFRFTVACIYDVSKTNFCVNTSYPKDNCYTDRRDRSRETTEKAVLYILPAGPVNGCAFARWRIVLPSCLDMLTSLRLSFGAWSVQTCFTEREYFGSLLGEFTIKQTLLYLTIFLLLSTHIMSSPGQKRGTCEEKGWEMTLV